MRILCFLGFCSLLSPGLLGQNRPGLSMVYEWKQLDYTYASDAERQQAIASGEHVPGNGVPIDVSVYYGSNSMTKTFVSIPRFQGGIPATFATVSNDITDSGPRLKPYPSWEWHRNSGACYQNRLVSVFRAQIDECGRLWVLDTGKIGSNQLCHAQIIAFDPATDRVLYRYEIPSSHIVSSTLLVTPVLDVRDPQNGCRDTFVYAADVTGFGLVVIDVRRNRSWRVDNKLFFPYPDAGTFTIAGESFDLMDGILGMALSPLRQGQDRTLYFHALASRTENHVPTSILRNETLFHEDSNAAIPSFQMFVERRFSQSAAQAMNKDGILFFGMLEEIAMACWNSATNHNQRNFDTVDRNPVTLQFPSGVKIMKNRKGEEELWVLTNRFQKIMTGTISPNETNFRILAARVDDLLANTKCRPKGWYTSAQTSGSSSGYYRPASYVNAPRNKPNTGDKLIFSN